MEWYHIKSKAKKHDSIPSISRYQKGKCKWNPTQIPRILVVLLLCFLLVFTFLIIVKGPGINSEGLFSRFIDVHNQDALKTNFSKECSIGSKESTDFSPTNYAYDKLLGGLLPEGLNESTCLSRYQWNLHRRTAGHRQPSPYLVSRLRKYEALHKQCGPNTSQYNAAVEYSKNSTAGNVGGQNVDSDCKYVIWIPPDGLGNRMLTLASAFLYALLTNRVILQRQDDSNMPDLFCEPFPESSWLIPSGTEGAISGFNVFDQSFPFTLGNMVKNHSIGKIVPPFVYLNVNNYYGEEDKRFFCDEDQKHLQKVTWLIVSSNQYFVPTLFSMPSFQQELDNLFPEKQAVFHHLGRYLFHPTNVVWGLITRYYEGYLAHADEKLGIQIRVVNDKGVGPLKHILDQILACTTTESLLPKLHDDVDRYDQNDSVARKLAVLVTSLRYGYYEELRNMYWQTSTISSGKVVSFYQPSHEELQRSGDHMHDRKALAEIYLLSLTDKLVISGWSTFGYVAHSLGGLQPWILYPAYDTTVPNPPCKLSMSMEPCFHFAPSSLVCGNETMSNILPHYVTRCEDVSTGLKLFDRHD